MLQQCADAVVLVMITMYTVLSLGYIHVMWHLRHNFFIALRSPMLACAAGFCLSLRGLSTTYEYVIAWGGTTPTDDGIVDIIGLPAILAAEGMATMRAVRLLLMYFPSKRKKWGSIPKEASVLRVMVSVFALMQIAIWSAAAVYGIPTTGGKVQSVLAPVALLLALVAGLSLGFQLSRVDDMCSVGRESLDIGACMIGSAILYGAILVVPMSTMAFKYAHVVFGAVSYSPIIWILNIAPIREILRQKDSMRSTPGGYVLIFGIIPWSRGGRRVVVMNRRSARIVVKSTSSATDVLGRPLDDIMGFAPLRDAFGEFCRKALCSESFDFLVSVAEFKHEVEAPISEATAVGSDFDHYLAIVREYIDSGACSEVNIDDRARHEALLYTQQHDFISLSRDQRADVFLLAEREINHMLSDNLLTKFRASDAYKELVDVGMLGS